MEDRREDIQFPVPFSTSIPLQYQATNQDHVQGSEVSQPYQTKPEDDREGDYQSPRGWISPAVEMMITRPRAAPDHDGTGMHRAAVTGQGRVIRALVFLATVATLATAFIFIMNAESYPTPTSPVDKSVPLPVTSFQSLVPEAPVCPATTVPATTGSTSASRSGIKKN